MRANMLSGIIFKDKIKRFFYDCLDFFLGSSLPLFHEQILQFCVHNCTLGGGGIIQLLLNFNEQSPSSKTTFSDYKIQRILKIYKGEQKADLLYIFSFYIFLKSKSDHVVQLLRSRRFFWHDDWLNCAAWAPERNT